MATSPYYKTLAESAFEVTNYNPDASAYGLIKVLSDMSGELAIFITDLPTEDPMILGQLWNDSGTPTESAGGPA